MRFLMIAIVFGALSFSSTIQAQSNRDIEVEQVIIRDDNASDGKNTLVVSIKNTGDKPLYSPVVVVKVNGRKVAKIERWYFALEPNETEDFLAPTNLENVNSYSVKLTDAKGFKKTVKVVNK